MNTRLSKIFGVKILPVAGKVTSTAKEMLDTEMEYIEYLRNRKKFFFMTQVQQTRVSVRGKSKKEEEKKKKGKGRNLLGAATVSYTHLTLPPIYSV